MCVPQENLMSLEQLVVEGADLLQGLPSNEGTTIQMEMLERFAGVVERCGAAAEQAGLPGLQDACFCLSEGVTGLGQRGQRDAASERRLLGEWSGLVLDYLGASDPSSAEEPASALLRHLQDGYWVTPLPPEDAEVLRELLLQGQPDLQAELPDERAAASETMPATGATQECEDLPSLVPPDQVSERNEAISADPDTLRLLQGEMSGLMDILMAFGAAEDGSASGQDDLEQIAALVERLATAAQAIGFPPLYEAYAAVQANLQGFGGTAESAAGSQEILLDWAVLADAYLENPQEADRARALVEILGDSRWPLPLAMDEADALVAGLTGIVVESSPAEARETEAGPDDVSLAVPDDINPELLEGLLQELPAQTTELCNAVEKLVLSGHAADVDTARRIAHTLKGAANVVGIRGLATLTHQLEDIFDALSDFGRKPPAPLAHTLIEAADCLAEMNDFLLGAGAEPAQALQVLQKVLDWANRIDREGIAGVSDASFQESDGTAEAPPETAPATPEPSAEAVAPPAPAQREATTPMLRVPATLLDNLLRLAGESIILSGRLQENVLGGIRQAKAVRVQNLALQRLIQELEHLVDVQGISLPGAGDAADSLDTSDFDPLELEQYNELYTVVRQMQEVATDSRELSHDIEGRLAQLKDLMVDQMRLDHEHQEATLLTRMVPVKTVEQRLYRGVRQASRLTGKTVSLTIQGADTLVEGNVLNDLIDPLMHVLRNAVDHGIEEPKVRERQGKPAAGRIELGFTREGNHILVRCQDDGAGLDYDAIRRTAAERGLMKSGFSATEDELNRFLMSPGFSTRHDVTQVSGRGIGMDVVQAAVTALKGSVYIHSQAGQGCRVDLRLPVTLLSTQALLVRLRQRLFAISERGVQQILHSDAGRLGRIGSYPVFETEGQVYDLKALDETLGFPTDPGKEQAQKRPVILVGLETEGTVAVLADELVDSREMVVKSMGPYVPRIPGIPGATILGDGSIIPVLDLPELMGVPLTAGTVAAGEVAVASSDRVMKTALVVDDSLSARRSLAQFVRDAGFNVLTAIDGLEAVGIVDAKKPDILLVDLEMPRMNGMELTAHLRANPETSELPVIMVTSRSTDKHRLQAMNMGVDAYVTKPFAEDHLLGQIHQLIGEA